MYIYVHHEADALFGKCKCKGYTKKEHNIPVLPEPSARDMHWVLEATSHTHTFTPTAVAQEKRNVFTNTAPDDMVTDAQQ